MKKVFHRDIKPENILIQPIENNAFNYVLTDFGGGKKFENNKETI